MAGGRYILFLMSVFIALLMGVSAYSQPYPTRPVRLIVPFAPGGGTDIIARVVAPHLSELLGKQLVIENRPGAGTIIGADLAAKSRPDGYTLFMGITGTMAINPSIYDNLPYDPVRDFAPIILMGVGPNVLVVHPSLPVKSVPELIAYAKANPGKLSYGSSGTGGAPHLAGELFKSMTGIDMVHVSYKGAAPATTDLLGGQVQVMFAGMGAALPFIKAGKLRALGTAGMKRSVAMPDLPTIGEYLKGYEASTWFGMYAPAATAKEIIVKLNADVIKVMMRSDVQGQLLAQGYETLVSTPEELGAYTKSELAKWSRVIRDANIPKQGH